MKEREVCAGWGDTDRDSDTESEGKKRCKWTEANRLTEDVSYRYWHRTKHGQNQFPSFSRTLTKCPLLPLMKMSPVGVQTWATGDTRTVVSWMSWSLSAISPVSPATAVRGTVTVYFDMRVEQRVPAASRSFSSSAYSVWSSGGSKTFLQKKLSTGDSQSSNRIQSFGHCLESTVASYVIYALPSKPTHTYKCMCVHTHTRTHIHKHTAHTHLFACMQAHMHTNRCFFLFLVHFFKAPANYNLSSAWLFSNLLCNRCYKLGKTPQCFQPSCSL